MKPHPLCNCIPEMSEADYEALKADIAEHGLRENIVLYDGMILDGRHRWRACTELHKAPRCEQFEGTVLQAMVLVSSRNLKRRHLTPTQISWAAAKMAEFAKAVGVQPNNSAPIGAKCPPSEYSAPIGAKSPPKVGRPADATLAAAEAAGVPRRSVQRARAVAAKVDAKTAEEIAGGKKTLHAAEKEIKAAAAPPPEADPIDGMERPIPKQLRAEFAEAESELQTLQSEIMRAKKHLTQIMAQPWSIYVDQALKAALERAWSCAKFARPFAVCPLCGGDKCKICKGRGWLPKDVHSRLPRESQ